MHGRGQSFLCSHSQCARKQLRIGRCLGNRRIKRRRSHDTNASHRPTGINIPRLLRSHTYAGYPCDSHGSTEPCEESMNIEVAAERAFVGSTDRVELTGRRSPNRDESTLMPKKKRRGETPRRLDCALERQSDQAMSKLSAGSSAISSSTNSLPTDPGPWS